MYLSLSQGAELITKILPFTEPEDLLQYSQQTTTGLYPKQDESSPHPYIICLRDTFEHYPSFDTKIFNVHCSSQIFEMQFCMRFSVSPMHATCEVHFSLFYFTAIIMYGENQYQIMNQTTTQVEDDPRQDRKMNSIEG